jgi:invasion protein IalB
MLPLEVVMLPLEVALDPGSRVIVDLGEPMNGPYGFCHAAGCFSDYEASVELIDKLKTGRNLIVQAMEPFNQAITLLIPLAGFAEAYDGPPANPHRQLFENERERWPLGDYGTPRDRERISPMFRR